MKCKKYIIALAGIVMLWNSNSMLATTEQQKSVIRRIRAKIGRQQVVMRRAKTLGAIKDTYKSATKWLSPKKGNIPQANFNKFFNDLKETYKHVAEKLIRNYPKQWMKTFDTIKTKANSAKATAWTDDLAKKITLFLAATNQLIKDGIISEGKIGAVARNFNTQATQKIKTMRTLIEQLKKKQKTETLESKILKKLVEKPGPVKKTARKRGRRKKPEAQQPEKAITILKDIKHYLIQAGHMLYDKTPQYNEKSIKKLGAAVANLEKALKKMSGKQTEDLKAGRNWYRGLTNIKSTAKRWHKLFSGKKPNFKTREISLSGAQYYGGQWYYDMKRDIQNFQKKAMKLTVPEQSEMLQSIYKVMLTLLDSVYYTVGAPAGGLYRIHRYIGLYNWPAFKLKKGMGQ